MQPDQYRLRARLEPYVWLDPNTEEMDMHGNLIESDTEMVTIELDDLQALIAREVRLGRYDELTKVEVYETYADTIEYIRNRERELKKELKSE